MRYVVFVCLAIGLLSRPALAQSAPPSTPVNALEDGISVTGVGRIANFTRHSLIFFPKGRLSGGSGNFGVRQTPWEDQVKQIALGVRSRQAALIETLERLKLGKVKTTVNNGAHGLTFGNSEVRYQLDPDTVTVYLTQKECDGETIGGLSRLKFLESIKSSTEDFTITLQSSVDSNDEKIWREATAQAIANGRASANAIASAGGVKLGKLVAAREEIEHSSATARSMTLTPEKAILTSTGGLTVLYALRFSIR